MAFKIPNEADAAFADQAEPDSVDFDVLALGIEGDGVVSGCAVTAQGTPDMTVHVAAGEAQVGTSRVTVSAGDLTIGAADPTNARFDLITVDSGGTKAVVAGTAAANAVYPAIPATRIVLAAVYIPANDTAIQSNQITDKRTFMPPRLRYYDAIVDPLETGPTIYATLAAAITAGAENILVRGDHSADADVSIGVGDAVKRIIGADPISAQVPNISCDKGPVLFEFLRFPGKRLTATAQGIVALGCFFETGGAGVTSGAVGNAATDLVIVRCLFNVITSGWPVDIVDGARTSVTACLFLNNSSTGLIRIGSTLCAVIGNSLAGNSGISGTYLIDYTGTPNRIAINGNQFSTNGSKTPIRAYDSWNIAGNVFDGGATGTIGVELDARNAVVSGNTFNGFAPAVQMDDGLCVVLGNVIIATNNDSTNPGKIKATDATGGHVIMGNTLASIGVASSGVEFTTAAAARSIVIGNAMISILGGSITVPIKGRTPETISFFNRGESDFYAPTDKYFDAEDFDTLARWSTFTTGAGASAALKAGTNDGELRLETGAVTNNVAGVKKPETHAVQTTAKRNMLEAKVQTQQTTQFKAWWGLAADWTNDTVEPVNGIYFRRDPGASDVNWFGVCRNTNVETTVDLGVLGTTVRRLGFFRTKTGIQFFVDGVATGAEITTNLPTVALRRGGKVYAKENVTKQVDVAYDSYGQLR